MNSPSTPDTIVLIHGFWVTPRSWEQWIPHYEAKGFRVLAPAYPGFDVEVEALNADPTPVAALTVPAIIEHLEVAGRDARGTADPDGPLGRRRVHPGLARPRVRRGRRRHELRTDRRCPRHPRVAGARDMAGAQEPPNHHKAVGLTYEQWHYTFTNTFDDDAESRRLYERYAVPASGRILWNSVLANLEPGPQDIWVDYHNDARPPLLFISGEHDHLMPPKVQRSNAKHYKSNTITEVVEFPGRSHLMPAQEGWEEVADCALDWALAHAGQTARPA